jgi:hypothetical protein
MSENLVSVKRIPRLLPWWHFSDEHLTRNTVFPSYTKFWPCLLFCLKVIYLAFVMDSESIYFVNMFLSSNAEHGYKFLSPPVNNSRQLQMSWNEGNDIGDVNENGYRVSLGTFSLEQQALLPQIPNISIGESNQDEDTSIEIQFYMLQFSIIQFIQKFL